MTEAAASSSFLDRINMRVVLFAGVVVLLVGAPLAVFIQYTLNKGIQDHGSYKEVDLKAMGNFMFDDVSGTARDIPEPYRKLDGQRILLSGEMYAPDEAGDRISQFQLVYSIQKCCFNGPPRVQERVFASVPKGGKVRAYGGIVKVMGTLHITMQKVQSRIVKVYELDVESVEPA